MAKLGISEVFWKQNADEIVEAVFLAGALAITGVSTLASVGVVTLAVALPGFKVDDRVGLIVSVNRERGGREARSYQFRALPAPAEIAAEDPFRARVHALLASQ